VEVVGTANVGQRLVVAALVSMGVMVADFGNSVKWLVDVADVVNDEAEGEGESIFLVREVPDDLVIVVGRLVVAGIAQHTCKGIKRAGDIVSAHREVVIIKAATVTEVGLVDEVPAVLEVVSALNLVGEVSALSERVLTLTLSDGGVGFLEHGKAVKSDLKDIGGLSLKNALGGLAHYRQKKLEISTLEKIGKKGGEDFLPRM
jgi:hypothetical protein